jgi:hypothetical protein
MKICFCWPYKENLLKSAEAEMREFYIHLKNNPSISLVDNFDEADFIIFMMDIRNCYNMPHYNSNVMDIEVVNNIKNHTNYKKEIIIDYNDYTDTRNVSSEILNKVGYYFKRSMVNKTNNPSLIKYNREIIPISYGIRSDYIHYDSLYKFTCYKYDICYLFDNWEGGNRGGNRRFMKQYINNYIGPKFIGRVYCPKRYTTVNLAYYDILKTSKIIVTANPTDWEGDFRLWEALLVGNLVLCDIMVLPNIMKYPLIDRKHLVFYNNGEELMQLINYYIHNEEERDRIGKEGKEYSLKHHKFSNRVEEVITFISK